MCGIVGLVSRRPVAEEMIKALGRLEYRGYDSAAWRSAAANWWCARWSGGPATCCNT